MVIYSIEWSKDGKYLISSDFDGVLKVFDSKKFDLLAQTPKMPTENRVKITKNSSKFYRPILAI